MSLKLEKYLSAQRKNLDVESPDDSVVWEGIKGRLSVQRPATNIPERKIRLIRIRNIAAAAFILFSLGYIVNDIINGKIHDRTITLSSLDEALGRREKEYKSLILYKTEEVSTISTSEDPIISELFEEIKKLDLIYEQAMTDLKELGSNEKVINTIFSTYEQRIRLLELIILESNKINRNENTEKIIL